jgi:CBS domain-containing protein
MRVRDVMRREPSLCTPGMDLAKAGRIMAEAGCGVLPVVGDEERVVGVITDRDLCLAVATRDRRPSEIQVRQAISGEVFTCGEDDEVLAALDTMRRRGVRRLPVLDRFERLVGLLSLDDLFAEARARPDTDGLSLEELVDTLGRIGQRQILATRD